MFPTTCFYLFQMLKPMHDTALKGPLLVGPLLIPCVSALMYASIFGNVSAIIQRLYSGTAR